MNKPGARIKATRTDQFHQFIEGDTLVILENKDELGLGSITANNLTRPQLTSLIPAVLILSEYTILEVQRA